MEKEPRGACPLFPEGSRVVNVVIKNAQKILFFTGRDTKDKVRYGEGRNDNVLALT